MPKKTAVPQEQSHASNLRQLRKEPDHATPDLDAAAVAAVSARSSAGNKRQEVLVRRRRQAEAQVSDMQILRSAGFDFLMHAVLDAGVATSNALREAHSEILGAILSGRAEHGMIAMPVEWSEAAEDCLANAEETCGLLEETLWTFLRQVASCLHVAEEGRDLALRQTHTGRKAA